LIRADSAPRSGGSRRGRDGYRWSSRCCCRARSGWRGPVAFSPWPTSRG